jgi:hypothetical protein
MRPESIPLIVLAALVRPGSDGCLAGYGEQAAGRVDGGGDVVEGCDGARGARSGS